MSIREAKESDIPRIVELGSLSLIEGPYRGIIKDKPHTAELAAKVIESKDGVILLYENGKKIIGLLAFIIYPHIFTGELTAGEIMWYVEANERKGGAGIHLLWEAEKKAKAMGAKYMGVTSPTTEVSAIYSRFGYKQLEISFLKEL